MRIYPRFNEGWSTFIILWAMLLVAAMAIFQTELIDGLHIIPISATIGMFTGTALAKSRFKDRTTYLFAIIFGIFSVVYLVGSILPGDLIWRERVIDIFTRQNDWIQKAINGGTSRDGLIFVIQTAAVYWLLGYTAAWYTFRYLRVWRVIVPSGLVLLSVVYYYNGPKPLLMYLALYAVLALLYVARTYLFQQEIEWRSTSVFYEKGIWFDFLRSAFIAAAVILLLSWSLPTLSASTTVNDALSGTQGPWRGFRDNWVRLFSSLRAFSGETADPFQASLVLGGPRTVGSTLIMDVYVPYELPNVYWQAVAYDTYKNGGWYIADNVETRIHYPDDGVLNVPATLSRQTIEQVVINYLPNSSYLYSAPEVISTDRQMYVESTHDDQDSELVTSLRSRFIMRQGDRYHVASQISNATAQNLRRVGTSYPQWVSDRYLQIPDSITPETVNLAESLTAPFDNPFDKAVAVRDYLRENITYNDQIPAPPDDVEPVHYTLFETQEGYCNYYASAMAIMLRSQGVPARVVSGYAQGEYDEATKSYRVRATNAHTWVEVYFPQYGWIQFEPTASIPVETRLESDAGDGVGAPIVPNERIDPAERLPEGEVLPNEDENRQEFRTGDNLGQETNFWDNFPVWQVIGVLVVILIAGIIVFAANEYNKRIEGNVERSYQRLGSWARWFNLYFKAADTPYERAEMMTTAVPEGDTPINNLTSQYVRSIFSANHQFDDDFDSLDQWRELRPLLIRRIITDRLHEWQDRWRR